MVGRINSFQTLGTLDGPGIRFVVFMQGCNLKCSYCHNPETWDKNKGIKMSAREVFEKMLKYAPYFGERGGITITGGEPLLQAQFLCELLSLCRQKGIHSAVDTNGTILTPYAKKAVSMADLIMIDLKMNTNNLYQKYIGIDINKVLSFIRYVDSLGKDIWIRQVILPSVNDKVDDIRQLLDLLKPLSNIKKVELLPFKKLCLEKYESMGKTFPLAYLPETTEDKIKELEDIIKSEFKN